MPDFSVSDFPCYDPYTRVIAISISSTGGISLLIVSFVALVRLWHHKSTVTKTKEDKERFTRTYRLLYHAQMIYFCLVLVYGILHPMSAVCQCHAWLIQPWVNALLFWTCNTVILRAFFCLHTLLIWQSGWVKYGVTKLVGFIFVYLSIIRCTTTTGSDSSASFFSDSK